MPRRKITSTDDPIIVRPMDAASWTHFIDDRQHLDQMVLQMHMQCGPTYIKHIHRPSDSQWVIFVGKEWADKFAHKKAEYGGLTMQVIEGKVAAIMPKYSAQGEPLQILINDKIYSTIPLN